jgi:16S rRNA (guanine966-N2)-methyltransferase
MRVIAGSLKGRRLVTPAGDRTRPTADQVRLALMDTLTPWLPDARFLDLFAGAGGVGLEALSRGAAHATFVERAAPALAALRRNVQALGVADRTRVLPLEAVRAVSRLAGEGAQFDLVFLDPPYEGDLASPVLERLAASNLLAPAAMVIAQHFTKRPPAHPGALHAFRTRRFGETTLTFLRPGAYDA